MVEERVMEGGRGARGGLGFGAGLGVEVGTRRRNSMVGGMAWVGWLQNIT